MGARAFHRFGSRNKLSLDVFNINEDRRGGDAFDLPLHRSTIAEAVTHRITTGALTYDQFFRADDRLSVFVSAQRVHRDSYYGADQSLADYGFTQDLSYSAGAQYRLNLHRMSLTLGLENQGGWLHDAKLGFPDYEHATIVNDTIVSVPSEGNTTVADQALSITGAFTQLDLTVGRLKTTLGLRLDHYRIADRQSPANDIAGNVLSPRITLKYEVNAQLQARLSYAKGYRAPQVFDEDLHIHTSAARQVLHVNHPDLQQETSHSYLASLDFNGQLGPVGINLLVEGFYTQLVNPFANEFGEVDADGVVVYTRVNAEGGAHVQGVNLDLTVIPASALTLRSGLTLQRGLFADPQEFDERRFFRSPNAYGYFTLGWDPPTRFGAAATGTYTGPMLVPYFGPLLANPEAGELRTSSPFFDLGVRLRYNVRMNGATLQLFGGVRNMLNAYQRDFDSGAQRDPGYMYGPTTPRTLYVGLRIGNRLR